MSVAIRTATETDQERCLEMIEALVGKTRSTGWSATFEQLLTGDRGIVLVADQDDVLLGIATVSFNLAIRYAGEYAQLEELVVDPAARGQKVGALLVGSAVEHARERGCAEFGLYLIEATEHNRPFYEKLGFEHIGSEMRQRL